MYTRGGRCPRRESSKRAVVAAIARELGHRRDETGRRERHRQFGHAVGRYPLHRRHRQRCLAPGGHARRASSRRRRPSVRSRQGALLLDPDRCHPHLRRRRGHVGLRGHHASPASRSFGEPILELPGSRFRPGVRKRLVDRGVAGVPADPGGAGASSGRCITARTRRCSPSCWKTRPRYSGLLVAFVGVLLGHLLENPYLDGAASIVIGLVLATVAVFLAYESRGLLVGESAEPAVVAGISGLVLADADVLAGRSTSDHAHGAARSVAEPQAGVPARPLGR